LSLSSAPLPARSPHLWRDLGALAGGQLASKLLGFAAFAYLARVLAPHAYGAVEYAAGLALIAANFVDAGLSPIGVRRIARDRGAATLVSAEILGARCLLAAAAALALAAGATWTAPDPLTARLVALFAVGLLAYPWGQMWLFQAVDRIAWTAAIQTVRMATFLLAVVVLVRGTAEAPWAGAAEIAGLALAGACALVLQQRHVAPVRLRFGLRRLRELLLESLPLALANLLAILLAFAPLLLAVNLLGAGPAAHFAAAHRLFFALMTFTWIYHFNFYPVLARAEAGAEVALRPLVESSLRLVAWVGAAAALVLTLAAGPLLAVMFGAPFAAAAGAFAWLVWALPAKLLADHAGWLLVATGGERALFAARTAGLAVAVAAGAPLVAAAGPAGGAAAMLAAALLVWTALHAAARRRLGWMPWRPALAPAAAALALLAALRALALPPLVAAALGTAALAAAAAPLAPTLLADYRRLASAKARAHAAGPAR
jgi:PST family polysaccharide transporter